MSTISVITVVKNNVSCIGDCLASVAGQDYAAVEHIVVDGGSTDGTLESIQGYRQGIAVLISEPDQGVYDAMNKGLALSRGEIVGFLNADDLYAHNRALSTVGALFRDDTVDSCFADLVYVAAADTTRVLRYWRAARYRPKRFHWGWMPPHPTFFVRRRIYEKYGGFRLDLGTAADYELMLRFLVKYRITTEYIPEVLIRMRTGGISNTSLRNRLLANCMDRRAWKVNGLKSYPWTLSLKPLRKLPQYFRRPEPSAARSHSR